MAENHRGISAIERLEHSDENDAKKVNNYVWNGSSWVRSPTLATMPTTLLSFVTTVTTAGTRVQLASNTVSNGFILQAPSTNTGIIYVGGSTVSSSVYGAELQPGQATSVAVDNTNKIYIDSSVSGEKCAVIGS